MWSVGAVIAFAVALVVWLAEVHKGVFLTWETFVIIGLICQSLATLWPDWSPHRRAG